MKIYAKILNPEMFDYRLYEGSVNPEIMVEKNRNYPGMNDSELETIKTAIKEYNCYDFNYYYEGSIKDYLNDYLPQKDNLKKLSNKEIHKIKEMLDNFEEDEDIVLACLEIIHHKPYKVSCIRGYCQGEWCRIYCPKETSQNDIDYLEAVYFGTGTEIEIHDEDNEVQDETDINGFTILTTKWNEKDIKEEIASMFKATSDDVVLFKIVNSYTIRKDVYERV